MQRPADDPLDARRIRRHHVPRRRRPGHHRTRGRADLPLQRRRQPEVAAADQRHDRRRAVRAVPRRVRRGHRQQPAGRAVDLQRPDEPAVDTSLRSADTQPPTVPGQPAVSNLTCNSVTFSWTPSTDNVGVAFYDIYHDGQLMTSVSGTHAVDQPDRGRRARPGACTSTRATRRATSPRRAPRVTITPPQCQADTQPPTAPSSSPPPRRAPP